MTFRPPADRGIVTTAGITLALAQTAARPWQPHPILRPTDRTQPIHNRRHAMTDQIIHEIDRQQP